MLSKGMAKSYTFKVLVIGESSVGKTAMMERFCENQFKGDYMSTIGMDFNTKTVTVNGTTCKLKIWDTAGQERFRNVTTSYYRGTQGCLVVYDVCNRGTFEMLDYWIDEYKREQPESEIIIVGNKTDNINERTVTDQQAEQFSKPKGYKSMTCSALNGNNVKEVFEALTTLILQNKTLMDNLPDSTDDGVGVNPEGDKKKCC
ncbi:hypothetical protein EIN_368780 [Entamoeba invadens IP1]|uniref:Rab family GTPase n=1 Tax=Entamoeba invadens IP1 TaxID=370355 RepID=A0A0A1U9N5_ENTIV|nr:hypothetical protein EIN_368780 [Entamoeba invadens IP1]ELP88830.1 hypothetical protein EIN_368780 [Entamoeba invadens IP1]|eukprot:XP_004255601.1 hypothetical protein EIN_368780 [Entamoeba invadens IP1]